VAADGESHGNGQGRPEAPPASEVEALVRSLIGMMGGGGITELDLAFGAVSVRLRGGAASAASAISAASAAIAVADAAARGRAEEVIAAPMIGTFYASPSPGEPPFVEVGDPVEVGQTIGIIEAMKIMNEIAADRAGIVTAVLVENAQPVEYGSPLLRVVGADGGLG
jgi:acetyl-CoA carboxylase biotin carboxyl carrier protein